jgi:hypothetical protein
MAFNHNAGPNGSIAQMQPGGSPPGGDSGIPGAQKGPGGRRRLFAWISAGLLILVVLGGIRIGTLATTTNDQLTIRIGDQQSATLDLRQSFPVSSYFLGTNVFPKQNSDSLDNVGTGFMVYNQQIAQMLKDMNIKLLRYPGGTWGEQHILSNGQGTGQQQKPSNQLADFTQMMKDTGTEGMLQVHLDGTVTNKFTQGQEPQGVPTDSDGLATYASNWVDYMNNPHSPMRSGSRQQDPFHPVRFWNVGNEPDLTKNPLTGKPYTVTEYANSFIQFSIKMHQNDQAIKVFGPEISQYYGVGAGPLDAGGHAWMDEFLRIVGDFEKQNCGAGKKYPYQLLDGVSFHRYPFTLSHQNPGLLLSSTDEWNYLLPGLREQIKRYTGSDLPIALTEINTNPTPNPNQLPSQAALWWGDTLGTLLNQQVSNVTYFSTEGVNNPHPLIGPDGKMTVMGRTTELFGKLQLFGKQPGEVVPLAIQGNPVGAYATIDNSHKTLGLFFVNKSAQQQVVQIDPVGNILSFGPWHSQKVTLAPYSMVVLTMHRSSSQTEAVSYTPKDDGTADDLTTVSCGAGANGIPC